MFHLSITDGIDLYPSYHGDLCDNLKFRTSCLLQAYVTYVVALVLKLYNSYQNVYLSIQIEAKQKGMKLAELIKHKYFIFFNSILESQDDGDGLKCFKCQKSFNFYWMIFNYLLLLLVSLTQGFKNHENSLVNMVVICSLDLFNEYV